MWVSVYETSWLLTWMFTDMVAGSENVKNEQINELRKTVKYNCSCCTKWVLISSTPHDSKLQTGDKLPKLFEAKDENRCYRELIHLLFLPKTSLSGLVLGNEPVRPPSARSSVCVHSNRRCRQWAKTVDWRMTTELPSALPTLNYNSIEPLRRRWFQCGKKWQPTWYVT